MVIATQNPIELEGTYPLPEAQLDRFLMRIPMGYPDRDAELAILEAQGTRRAPADELEPVVTADDVAEAAAIVGQVHVAPELRGYILDLVDATRRHPDLVLGASPRGSLALQRAARALAASFGRAYVIPDDVKRVVPSVLEHRLLLAPDAQLRGVSAGDVVDAVLASVPVPGATARLSRPDRAAAAPAHPSRLVADRREAGLALGSFLLGAVEMLVLAVAAARCSSGARCGSPSAPASTSRSAAACAPTACTSAPRAASTSRSRTGRRAPPRCSAPPTGSTRAAAPRASSCRRSRRGRRARRVPHPHAPRGRTASARSRSARPTRSAWRRAQLAAVDEIDVLVRPRVHEIAPPVAVGSRVQRRAEAVARRRWSATSATSS